MRLIINNGIVINPSVLHVNAKGNLKISCPVAEDGKCCSLITQHTGLMLLMLKYCKKDTIVDCSHFVGDDCKDVDGYVHLSLKLTLERISAMGMDEQRKDDNFATPDVAFDKVDLRAKRSSNDEFEERSKELSKAALANRDLVDDICNTGAAVTHGVRMSFVSNPSGFK
ncbi:hypothetical protein CU097_008715 [Rhizopus azygosporus]|uniref:Uncharacterized protein n=1 Tax=Rhizopus azygosporus TaxID=86630 RepID=A0A367JAT8_RHIAZ|nr:hypothetical protein CU097_008715 [Rhizopus azygosporus]